MKVKITRPTRAGGKSLAVGKTYDLSEKDAKTLLALRKAVLPKSKGGKDSDDDTGGPLDTTNAGGLVGGAE
jgi:hypothetical protein